IPRASRDAEAANSATVTIMIKKKVVADIASPHIFEGAIPTWDSLPSGFKVNLLFVFGDQLSHLSATRAE
ncbi:hypothetical protein, partial [Vibrio vulnificus]|uniref:hypothetical protein n=1 Tax=Vibrio vulnificus TaxID=672 RepID=UPI00057FF473